MEKIIQFNNDDFTIDHCCGEIYRDFLDYAFLHSDYFMLVYVNRDNHGYTEQMKYYRKALSPYEVKCRTNQFWPGSGLCSPDDKYQIVFYRNIPQAKQILAEVYKLSDWSAPTHPQDLAFYKGNQCWFCSIAYIKDGVFIHPTEEDFDFVESRGLAKRSEAFEVPNEEYYYAFDEVIEE